MPDQLTDREVKMVNLIEQRFYETGNLPTNDKIAEDLKFSPQIVKNAWKKPLFRQALVVRGIDLNPEESTDLLSGDQLLVANMVLNVHDKTSLREKLKTVSTALGKTITVNTYNAWMNQPAFQKYIKSRIEREFKGADSVALLGHIKAIHGGDMKAIELYYEMTGRHNRRVQVDVNIEVVLVNVIEIISKHVNDPEILQAIANDIEKLEIGPGKSNVIDAASSFAVESYDQVASL